MNQYQSVTEVLGTPALDALNELNPYEMCELDIVLTPFYRWG